jgi:hypothetical protein
MGDGDRSPARFFYGLQPRWLRWDRLYRVYVCEAALAGAYVAGQIYDEPSAAVQLQQLGPLVSPIVRGRLARRHEREMRYDGLDPFGADMLAQDPRNFHLPRTEVVRARFRRSRSLWTAFNVGSVELELQDGTKRRFILVGDQDPDTVFGLVREFDPRVELTGRPNQRQRPASLAPVSRRLQFALLAVFLFGCAALLGYAAWAGVGPPSPILWPLAVANLALGGRCLVWALMTGAGDAGPADTAESANAQESGNETG